jgi:hypothetical protein
MRDIKAEVARCRLATAAVKAQQEASQSRPSPFAILRSKAVYFLHLLSQPSAGTAVKQG